MVHEKFWTQSLIDGRPNNATRPTFRYLPLSVQKVASGAVIVILISSALQTFLENALKTKLRRMRFNAMVQSAHRFQRALN